MVSSFATSFSSQRISALSFLFRSKVSKPNKTRLVDFPNLMNLMMEGILDSNGLPSKALLQLSKYLQLESTAELGALTAAWDKFFVRHTTTGKPIERWELQSLKIGTELENHRSHILPLIKETGLLKSRGAQHKYYDTVLVHGARLEDIEVRLKFIAQYWKNGGRFARIVVLTGERPLADDEMTSSLWSYDPAQSIAKKGISTEIELMQYAWEANNIVPKELSERQMIWINTPNFRDRDGELRRANTEDTIDCWLNSEISADFYWGDCLAIANTPLILREHAVFERKLSVHENHFRLETVGLSEEQEGDKPIIYYLREIAGLLWELNKLNSSPCKTGGN